ARLDRGPQRSALCRAHAALARRGDRGLRHGQIRDIDPAALLPAPQRAFHQLYTLGAFQEIPAIGGSLGDVADEGLPLHFAAGVDALRVGHHLPAVIEVDRLLDVGIPNRLWRPHALLRY